MSTFATVQTSQSSTRATAVMSILSTLSKPRLVAYCSPDHILDALRGALPSLIMLSGLVANHLCACDLLNASQNGISSPVPPREKQITRCMLSTCWTLPSSCSTSTVSSFHHVRIVDRDADAKRCRPTFRRHPSVGGRGSGWPFADLHPSSLLTFMDICHTRYICAGRLPIRTGRLFPIRLPYCIS